jgi:hypothetical protein
LVTPDLNNTAAIFALEEMVDHERKLARPDGPVPFHLDPAIGAVWRFQMLDRTLQVIGHTVCPGGRLQIRNTRALASPRQKLK